MKTLVPFGVGVMLYDHTNTVTTNHRQKISLCTALGQLDLTCCGELIFSVNTFIRCFSACEVFPLASCVCTESAIGNVTVTLTASL